MMRGHHVRRRAVGLGQVETLLHLLLLLLNLLLLLLHLLLQLLCRGHGLVSCGAQGFNLCGPGIERLAELCFSRTGFSQRVLRRKFILHLSPDQQQISYPQFFHGLLHSL